MVFSMIKLITVDGGPLVSRNSSVAVDIRTDLISGFLDGINILFCLN